MIPLILGTFRWVEWLVVAAVAASIFLAGMGAHKMFSDRKIANIKAEHAQQREQWATQSAESQKRARSIEAFLQSKAEAAQRKAADERKELETRFMRVAADNDRLRNLANQRASGAGEDSLAACRADAAALGDVFNEARDAATEMANAAERHASEVRLCLEAWPK